LASALILTERETSDLDANVPKVPGRIITTIEKAKEVRPIVEKTITLAIKGLQAEAAAVPFAPQAERGTDAWKAWRKSENWQKWAQARAPGVTARRRALQLLGDKQAVGILFDKVAPRFVDRPGGYTRILRLAKPRVGDAGTRAILEFVGKNDRVSKKASKPSFE
jgi:large subunit ribosomal protein L17